MRALLIGLLFINQFAFAQDVNTEDCTNSASGYCRSQIIHQAYADADRDLNIEYQKLVKLISQNKNSARLKPFLTESQKSWLQFRDKSCNLVAEIEGAKSGQDVQCLTNLTFERTSHILDYQNCISQQKVDCNQP